MNARSAEKIDIAARMKGKAAFCDMADAVLAARDQCYFDRDNRTAGTFMKTDPVRAAVRTIARSSDEEQEGFSFALAGFIANATGDVSPYMPQDIRALSADCFGPGAFTEADSQDQVAAPAETSEWRVTVHDGVQEVRALLDAVRQLDITGNTDNAFAVDVAAVAEKTIDAHEGLRRTGSADDYYGECMREVHALVRSATSLPKLTEAMRKVLEGAHAKVTEIVRVLDVADLAPNPPVPPGSSGPLSPPEPEGFMEGKSLCADMVAEAIEIDDRGSDEADLEARFRGRGVPQNGFARKYLLEVMRRPQLLEGFAAALSNTLRVAGSGNDSPDTMRALTYEEHVGGPSTKYMAEEDGDPAPEPTAEPSSFPDPFEQRVDELLKALDTYLEGLEHVGIGQKPYNDLHEHATPYYWNARNLLNAHETADRIVTEICTLRDGLEVLALGNDLGPGLPLVRECIRLINHFLDEGDDGGAGGQAPSPNSGNASPANSDVFPSPDRIEIARRSAAYIGRVVGYFQAPGRLGTMGDLDAIGKSASVILSALDDPIEGVESLQDRLDDALTSASVVFEEQPPRYWKSPSGIQKQAVGKHLVPAMDWH